MAKEQTNYLDVKGMYCSACSARIEKVVSKMDGVSSVHINLATETGRVTFNKNKISMKDIVSAINKIGFEAKTAIQHKRNEIKQQDKQKEIRELRWKFICSAILTLPLAWAMFAHFQWATFFYIPPLLLNPFFQFFITIPIQFVIGYSFYERAWKAVINGSTNMDVLVVLSTTTAFFYSHYLTFSTSASSQTEPIVLYYETSAFIITFILLGRFLEAKTKWRTTEALEKLYQVQTKTATLYVNGDEIQLPVEQLLPGDVVIIKPGEKVPIDGQVLEGNSLVDESLLTGESIPVAKKMGTFVYAGTINQNGVLKMKVTKQDSETTLSNIIKIVEDAQASKAPIQQIADRITGVFIPIVMMIAIVTFGVWYFLFQPGYVSGALEKMIAVLIIACPCALGLATPTSIMVGSGRAAQMGILFKEGKFIELLGKCKTIILDKTGTITTGVPQVTDIYVYQYEHRKFLKTIGAIERGSDHPVAKAIVNEVKAKVGSFPTATQVKNIPSYGIKGVVNGIEVVIANPTYFKRKNISLSMQDRQLVQSLKEEGKTVMIVMIDHRFAGIIAVFDEVKPSSTTAINRLQQMGYKVILATGDHHRSGLAVAKKVGIDHVYTTCTPSDKATIIQQSQKEGDHVVMVGDGINDAPALAMADVGVAIGTGSDIAIESGDVTIIKGNLLRLIDAIHMSKKTMMNIKQNFLWAFLYNLIMVPFAMVGILVPWLAGAAMAFSSISVVLNALRLKRVPIQG
ncbi:MAG TPA: heavy metal translocating P-type ATPase [Bacillota bacterium]